MYKQKLIVVEEEKYKVQKNFDKLKKDNVLVLNLLDSVLVNQSNIMNKLSGSKIGKIQENLN